MHAADLNHQAKTGSQEGSKTNVASLMNDYSSGKRNKSRQRARRAKAQVALVAPPILQVFQNACYDPGTDVTACMCVCFFEH